MHNRNAQWTDFVDYLSDHVDWKAPHSTIAEQIEDAFDKSAVSIESVAARFLEVIEDPALFSEYSVHFEYPRAVMDKFLLYLDPADRFRVRLHKFKPPHDCLGVRPTLHDHRWLFSSLILTGAYTEQVFSVEKCDEALQKSELTELRCKEFQAGDINWLPPGTPHVIEMTRSSPCFTLFVRAASERSSSRVFDREAGTFYSARGLKDELRSEARLLVALSQQ